MAFDWLVLWRVWLVGVNISLGILKNTLVARVIWPYNIHPSIHIHFRLRCCLCPILWGWQHQTMWNTSSPSISVQWVKASQTGLGNYSSKSDSFTTPQEREQHPQLISRLLLTWWHEEPGHQQVWYWPSDWHIVYLKCEELPVILKKSFT